MSGGFFDSFRVYGGPTLYPENKTPVTADVLEAGLIYAIVTLAVGFFLVLPGVRGKEVRTLISYRFKSHKYIFSI